jgi:hypothetical protein
VIGPKLFVINDNGDALLHREMITKWELVDSFYIGPWTYGDKKKEQVVLLNVDKHFEMTERLQWLECLEAAGVDSWEGFGEARNIMNEGER